MNLLRLFSLVLFFSIVLPVRAAIIEVVSTDDSGGGTLRQSLIDANNNDTIIINVSGIINAASTMVLNSKSDITVIGPYASHLTITSSAGWNGSIIEINNCSDITFKNLGFVGGNGGTRPFELLSNAGFITFERCLFDANTTTLNGGAISCDATSLNTISCSFIGNNAPNGGAIHMNTGILYSENCSYINNSAIARGGAINSSNATVLEFVHNTFSENSAGVIGQCIDLGSNSTVVSMQATAGAGNGSGVQFAQVIAGQYLSNSANIIKLNGGVDATPWIPFGSDYSSTIVNVFFHNPIVTDGYGMKYYTIVNCASDFVDVPLSGGTAPPLEDARRAPRTLTGNCSPGVVPNPAPLADAGAIEFTLLRVVNNGSNAGTSNSLSWCVQQDFDFVNYVEFDAGNIVISPSAQIAISGQAYIIDGYSQTGSKIPGPELQFTSGVIGAELLVHIQALSPVNSGILLNGNSHNSRISGLRITNFAQNGIEMSSVNGVKVEGCEIGITDGGGVNANGNTGFFLEGAFNCLIGGNEHANRNVISGNGGSSFINANIFLDGSSTNNTLTGNFVGVRSDGLGQPSPVTPGVTGILVNGSSNFIGKPGYLGSKNIISGNTDVGIRIFGTIDNLVQNNFIGTDYNGSFDIPNDVGIHLDGDCSGLLIGGLVGSGARNVISGNQSNNIIFKNANNSLVHGNIIGANESGTNALGAPVDGVLLDGPNLSDISIGGLTADTRNVISGNQNGIHLINTTGNVLITNNFIGSTSDGLAIVANNLHGIFVDGVGVFPCSIGSTGAGNLIVGHTGGAGIKFFNSNSHFVFSNLIGLNASNNGTLGNSVGIDIDGSASITIGGDLSLYRSNTISGNVHGILVHSSSNITNIGSNFIGTDSTGMLPFGNITNGIKVENASNTTIGGSPFLANVISDHNGAGAAGIFCEFNGNNTVINSNRIGTNASGTAPIPNETGIRVTDNHNAIIGSLVGAENYICANTFAGIHSLSPNVVMDGNFVGVGVGGATILLGNAIGILVETNSNIIGQSPNNINVISNNTSHGIHLKGDLADFNAVNNCWIGLDQSGNPMGNLGEGMLIENGDQNNVGNILANHFGANTNNGLFLTSSADSNLIIRNNFGNLNGISATVNGLAHLQISNGDFNVIGANALGAGNIFGASSPGSSAIAFNTADSNIIKGNLIGIEMLDNPYVNGVGINLVLSEGNVIGLDWSGIGAENVISNIQYQAMLITNSPGNIVAGNKIGTTVSGAGLAPNTAGVAVTDTQSQYNQIGGSTLLGLGNIISGCNEYGIVLGADSNFVMGNILGSEITGTNGFNMQDYGVWVNSGATGNQIGGKRFDESNFIAGNELSGIFIDEAPGNFVFGNIIGGAASGNQNVGIEISGTASSDNHIGKTPAYIYGNFIYGNTSIGINILNGAFDNVVRNNAIGLDTNINISVVVIQNTGIHLDATAGLNQIGVDVANGKNVISGNSIGIHLDGTNGQTIFNNYIGTDTSGILPRGNTTDGILIDNAATNNTIGGSAAFQSNLISGNDLLGVHLEGVGTNSNIVIGNEIGITSDGSAALGNVLGVGIESGPSNNFIGLAGVGNGNTIVGNSLAGIDIYAANTNHIRNNAIGLLFPNNHGVLIDNGSWGNVVGGSNNEGNVISGNDSMGIVFVSAPSNFVRSNIIGLNPSGTAAVPNLIGVFLDQSTTNTIGSVVSGEENVISGNTFLGIGIENASNTNTITNNFIGTDLTGNDDFVGSGNGIGIAIEASSFNTIGGDWNTNQGNVICSNTLHGVNISNASLNVVRGNNIGLSKNNDNYMGNTADGVRIGEGSTLNTIGQPGNGNENVITANTTGIHVTSSNLNTVRNNYIGNDDVGGTGLVNSGSNNQLFGILVDSTASFNTIDSLNIISGNQYVGVSILNPGTSSNVVRGNYIGVDLNGYVSYPNDSVNVYIAQGATSNVIGGNQPWQRNIIGGDAIVQVFIGGTGTNSNQIAGNYVGIGIDDLETYNTEIGIAVIDSASNNVIGGGAGPGYGNFIPKTNSHAIYLGNQVAATDVMGNTIGLYPGSLSAGSIGGTGIRMEGSDWNKIGGILKFSDSANVITNCQTGVDMMLIPPFNSSYGNAIIGNSIYNNAALGIDINADGLNQQIDTNQTGGNNGDIDFPLILTAWNCGVNNYTHVGFEFYSNNALAGYRVEFYLTGTPEDNTFHGEGLTYLGDWVFNPSSNVDTIAIDLDTMLTTGTMITATITGTLLNTSEFSANFAVEDAPTFNPPNTVSETCLGAGNGEILINAPGAYYFSIDGTNYSYGIGGDTISAATGTYAIEAVYLNGCTLTSTATINPGLPIDVAYIVVPDTCGQGVGSIVTDTSATNLGGGSGNYQYSYDGGAAYGSSIGVFGLNAGTTNAGIFDLTLGCYSDIINVVVPEITDVVDESFVFPDFCPDDIGQPTSTATSGGTWEIYPLPLDAAFIDSGTGALSNTTPGTVYSIVYTVGVCNEGDTTLVTAFTSDDSAFTYTSFCLGTTPSISTNTPGGTWELITGTGTIDINTGILVAVSGVYDIAYHTAGNCPNSDTIQVTIYSGSAAPVISSSKITYCPYDPILPINATGVGGSTVNWYDDGLLTNLVGSGGSFTPSSLSTGNNYIYATSTDGNGCESAADSLNYFEMDLSGMYAGSDQDVCFGSTIQLESFGGDNYAWQPSTQLLDAVNMANPTANITIAEIFIVQIMDTSGCLIIDSTVVNLIPQDQCTVDVYNAFSPNNDGTNDFWILDGIEGFPENQVFIYNRWGDIIIDFVNYNNTTVVWDGKNKNGRDVPMGTYFYVVQVGGAQNQANWVQVMR